MTVSPWSRAFSSSFRPWPLGTEISPVSLNLFTILWTVDGKGPKFFAILHWVTLSLNWQTKCWTTTHPCLQWLSLWWMLLLYSILITSPVTRYQTANCGTFQKSITCNLFSLVLPLSQLFVCCRLHILLFFIFTKYIYVCQWKHRNTVK